MKFSLGRWIMIAAGLALTGGWLAVCFLYARDQIGWSALQLLLPHEQAMMLTGVVTPIVALWLILFVISRSTQRGMAKIMRSGVDAQDRFIAALQSEQAAVARLTESSQRQVAALTAQSDKLATELPALTVQLQGLKQDIAGMEAASQHLAQAAQQQVASVQDHHATLVARLAEDDQKILARAETIEASFARALQQSEKAAATAETMPKQIGDAINAMDAAFSQRLQQWQALAETLPALLTKAQNQFQDSLSQATAMIDAQFARLADGWAAQIAPLRAITEQTDDLRQQFAAAMAGFQTQRQDWAAALGQFQEIAADIAKTVESALQKTGAVLTDHASSLVGQFHAQEENWRATLSRLADDAPKALREAEEKLHQSFIQASDRIGAASHKLAEDVKDLAKLRRQDWETLVDNEKAAAGDLLRRLSDQREAMEEMLRRQVAELSKSMQHAVRQWAKLPERHESDSMTPAVQFDHDNQALMPIESERDMSAPFAPAAWVALRRLRAQEAPGRAIVGLTALMGLLIERWTVIAGKLSPQYPSLVQILSQSVQELDSIADHLLAQAGALQDATDKITDAAGGDAQDHASLTQIIDAVSRLQSVLRAIAVSGVGLIETIRERVVTLSGEHIMLPDPPARADSLEEIHDLLLVLDQRLEAVRRQHGLARQSFQDIAGWTRALPDWLDEPSSSVAAAIGQLKAGAAPRLMAARLPGLQSRLSALGSVTQSRLHHLGNLVTRGFAQLDEMDTLLSRESDLANRAAVKAALTIQGGAPSDMAGDDAA